MKITLAIPVPEELKDQIRHTSGRLEVTELTPAQQRAYREGRPLWPGYPDPPQAEEESDEEAKARLEAILADTEVLLTNPVVPTDIVARAPRLKWLQLTAAGVDRLLDAPVLRSRVAVATVRGIAAVPISEYVIGAMIAFAKGFPRAMRAQRERVWRPHRPEELEGKTAGVLGVGAIGARVAQFSRALGMRVLAIRRSAERAAVGAETGQAAVDEMLPPSQLPYLLRESDYVVIALPLTPETRGLIGEAEFGSMRPHAVIVNIGRGAIIDEPALVRALKEGRIGGAALDVFQHEPLSPESELWGLENVMVTPHISGITPRYMDRAVEVFCDNLRRHAAGEPLRNVVDPARGY